MHIKLGDIARDAITGFEGHVYGICHYQTGCDQALLLPPVKDDGTKIDGQWFDVDRLTKVREAKPLPHNTRPGGPSTETMPSR